MENYYEFKWDCGRGGNVNGRFLAKPEEVEKIIGTEVYFGEILGKHSEVYGIIEKGEITLVTDDQDFIKRAEELKVNLCSGYNPFHYVKCTKCGDRDCGVDVMTGICEYCKEEQEEEGLGGK